MLSVVRYGGILYVNDILTQDGKFDCIHEKYGMKMYAEKAQKWIRNG